LLVKVASAKDVGVGTMLGAEVSGKLILVANVDGKYYAIGGESTHMGCKLSDGTLKEGAVVECPCHGSNFDLKTGNVVKGPATMPEPAFQVKVEKNKLLVDVPSEANTVHSELDLYVDIHKGQRHRFFKIATQAGILNQTDPKAIDALYEELYSFREHMRLHAHIEETCVHPVLSQRVPGGARQLEEEHRVIRQKFDDLIANFEGIRAKPVDFEKRGELALEFYRAWSRFTAFYFMHINREEEQVMPILWNLCTPEEIAKIHRLMITNQKQEELVEDFKMMLPNANLQGQVEILGSVRATLPLDVYQVFLKLAERLLEPKDWANLKEKLGFT
jgi:nitrite reductase/ring-hydroxylating ferredoxin subunit/hemerythrin-like domain-containing protein